VIKTVRQITGVAGAAGQGIISPKLQPLSGYTTEQRLAVYWELALSQMLSRNMKR
jgi:hypothetical protein